MLPTSAGTVHFFRSGKNAGAARRWALNMRGELAVALIPAGTLCGCQREYDPLHGRQVTAVEFTDVKLQTHSRFTESSDIARVTSRLGKLRNNWRHYWVTMPMHFGSITFYDGTNNIGTLFIGQEWMSFEGKIRTSSRDEIAQLWESVSEKGIAQPSLSPVDDNTKGPR